MILRKLKTPNAVMLTGMAALLAANILHVLLRWAEGTAETVVSGTMGLLYGVSFALLLWSVRLKARRT
jgi:hypothetical protein